MVIKGRAPHILTAAVEELWASQKIEDQRATPPEIHRLAIRRFGEKSISLRTVQSIVRFLEQQQQSEELPEDSDWFPWVGPETPNETALLMEVDLQSKIWLDRPLRQLEARWAVRIAPSVTDLGWFSHWTLARQYAHRDRLASLLGVDGQQPPNEFLNTLLAIKPWVDGRHDLWTTAVQVGFSEWQQKLFYDIAPFDTRPELVEFVYRDLNLNIEGWSIREPFDEDWTLRELQSRRALNDEESVILEFDPDIEFDGGIGDEDERESEFEFGTGDEIAAGEYIELATEPEVELTLVEDEADEGDSGDEADGMARVDYLQFEPDSEFELVPVEDGADADPAPDEDRAGEDDDSDEEEVESFEDLQRRVEQFLKDNEPDETQ